MFFASNVNPCACITELAMNLIYISSAVAWGTNFKGKTNQGSRENITLRSHYRGLIKALTWQYPGNNYCSRCRDLPLKKKDVILSLHKGILPLYTLDMNNRVPLCKEDSEPKLTIKQSVEMFVLMFHELNL